MKELYEKYKLFFIILILAVVVFLAWYFSQILIFILVAGVISIVGNPLVELLDKIRIGKFRFPHGISVAFTLILIIVVFFGLFSFFIPLLFKEANMIASIDGSGLLNYYQKEVNWWQAILVQYGILPKGQTIPTSLKEMILRLINFGMFSNILGSVISFAGNFFFYLFSILFLSFFFLYDIKMMPGIILLLIPEKLEKQTKNVMRKSKTLLSRYFIGLILQIILNIFTYSIALSIIGVKGALVIAFFAGIIIIIPYLGGIIAILTAIILGVTGVISVGDYGAIGPMAIKILIAMLVCQMVDNNLFQPYIQGKVVKAHPVEVFLVIIAAASIGGIPAMIVAVPAYGFLRIIATEFLSEVRLVKRIKEKDR